MEAPRHPDIARALGDVGRALTTAGVADGAGVVVGCSGGADSVALLGLLWRLARKRGWRLVVGHVDHGLRPESVREAQQVRELCAAFELPCEITRITVAPGPDLAARARDLRRESLQELGRRHAASWIALGHTATDQVETVLLNLTRGAGVDGLGGMPPAGDGVVRPLLGMSRARVRDLAERMQLPFVDDPSNDDRRHPRVRVRMEVLPQLRRLNPSLEQTVSEALAQVRAAADLVHDLAGAALANQLEVDVGAGSGPRGGQPPPGRRVRPQGWRAIPAVVRLQALRDFCVREGVDSGELAVGALRDVDAALCEWDAHLEDARRPAVSGGARPRTFCVHPERRLCVGRWGLHVEYAGAAAPDGP